MAHFAYVVDGLVDRVEVVVNSVITDKNGLEVEALGQQFLATLYGLPPESFIQCSYNSNFRGVYPGIGYTYEGTLDAFIPPKPEDGEWVLNEETFTWEPVEV
jgi:hypothetical protein